MQRCNRTKQTTSLEDRLAAFVRNVRERALQLPPGPERKERLKKAERAEATHPEDWISSRELRPQNNGPLPLGTSPRAQTYSQAGIEPCSQVSSSKPAGAAVRGGGSVSYRVLRRRPESTFLIATVSRHINHNRVGRYCRRITDGHGFNQ